MSHLTLFCLIYIGQAWDATEELGLVGADGRPPSVMVAAIIAIFSVSLATRLHGERAAIIGFPSALPRPHRLRTGSQTFPPPSNVVEGHSPTVKPRVNTPVLGHESGQYNKNMIALLLTLNPKG
jgi:hypothetical protein